MSRDRLQAERSRLCPVIKIKLQTVRENTLKANFIVSRVFAGLHTTDKAITYSLMSMQLSSCWNETGKRVSEDVETKDSCRRPSG